MFNFNVNKKMSNEPFEDELDDLDFGDDVVDVTPTNPGFQPVNEEEDEDNSNDQDDFLIGLLKERGIKDPNDIKFEDEQGIITSRSWNDLSDEEQRNILNQGANYDPESDDLDDDEIELLNKIRESGKSVEEYLNSLNTTVEQPQNLVPQENYYSIDELTDDELYVLDLQAKSDEITEEEAVADLQQAKQNESLFKKRMEGLRNDYKKLEDEQRESQNALRLQQEQEQFNNFAQSIKQSIEGLDSFGALDVSLEQDDKEELAAFILGRDDAGISYFGKALNDPETLVRMAWFALHGVDTFNEINEYMSDTIKKSNQAAYEKGLAEGKKQANPRVVVKPESKPKINKPSSLNSQTEYVDFGID